MESEPLYFNSMTVSNIRCFRDDPQTLDLTDDEGKPAKWNLILGDNGVGKTTLLQCLTSSLLLSDSFKEYEAATPDIRGHHHEEESEFLRRHFSQVLNSSIDTISNSNPLATFNVQVSSRDFPQDTVELQFTTEHYGTCSLTEIVRLPLIWAYGPERSFKATPTPSERLPASSLFDPGSSNLINVRTWLRELDYAASKESEVQQLMQDRLENIQSLLVKILPDVSDIRITVPTKKDPEPDVEFLTPYGWVELKNVAYGYQSLVAWVADFSYRLIERCPDSDDPLAEPAICLIDELDLHLHPAWQRDVMSYLADNFPNTQFIATVHSPLVVQAAPSVNANVTVLRRVQGEPFDHVVIDNDPEIIRSWRLDQLLASDLFATTRGPISARNPQVQEKLDERRQILSKSKLSKSDKQRLTEITEQIDMVPVSETTEHKTGQQLLSESYKLLAEESDAQ